MEYVVTDHKLIEANTKLVDEKRVLLKDIRLLIKYIKGNTTTKEDLQDEIDNLIESYK